MKNKVLIIGICVVIVVIILSIIINKQKTDKDSETITSLRIENVQDSDERVIYDDEGNVRGKVYDDADLKIYEDNPDFYVEEFTPAMYNNEAYIQQTELEEQ